LTESSQSSWDRLQSLLESLTPGDQIHLAAASRQTGLPPATCETVLDALTRVDLFTRIGDHTFVRRRMIDLPEPHAAVADTRRS
jgi:DNA-binding IclR family transcriptional regulator